MMKSHLKICVTALFLFYLPFVLMAQKESTNLFSFRGQLSGWGAYSSATDVGYLGARYLPQLDFKLQNKEDLSFDIELSANMFGEMSPIWNSVGFDGNIKPYRAWARLSGSRFELRAGLQKINFGSAKVLRPLMWFDKMDARDPLQMTDGVWGTLFKYYMRNNANIWIWGLMFNQEIKGWEITSTVGEVAPEFGGRFEMPLGIGEGGLTYHTRRTTAEVAISTPSVREHKLGLDIRVDVGVGLWLESSIIHTNKSLNGINNQMMTTLGGDYTVGVGNGVGITLEHLFYAFSGDSGGFRDSFTNYSVLNLNYPISLATNINTILYYDWRGRNIYTHLSIDYTIGDLSFYLIGHINPDSSSIPLYGQSDRFMGKGARLMIVYNH